MACITSFRGKWRCQVRRKGYSQLSRTFVQRADAATWGSWAEAQLLAGRSAAEILAGSPDTPSIPPRQAAVAVEQPGWTVGDLIRRYLAEVSPQKKSGKYDASTMRHMLAQFGKLPITALSSAALANYKVERLRLVSASTVLHELAILHRAYVLAREDWGIEFAGPIPRTRRPAQPRGRTRRVTDGELDRILAATESVELRIIARFAVATAMRRGEIMSMRWENIDLSRSRVLLPETKNGRSRTVPLSRWAVALLESVGPRPGGAVFALRPDSVSQMFGYAAKRARVNDVRFHDLRHEATSRLFEKGLNQIEVSRITGHLTLSMLDRYTHLDVSHLVQKLDAPAPRSEVAPAPSGMRRKRDSRKRGLWRKVRRAAGDGED